MSLPPGTRRGISELARVRSDEDLPARADVVIVGGGIVGTAAALYLARGGHSVLLCEKGRVGAEQSARNWGWVRQMGRDVTEIPLAVESLRLWRGFASEGIQTGFRETGIAYVGRTSRERAVLDAWQAQGREHGLPVRRLTGQAVQELVPGLEPDQSAALHMPGDGSAEPGMATPALAHAARAAGARIVTGCAVRGVDLTGDRVAAAVTERGRVACGAVLVAGGAWSRLFLGNLGIRFPQLRLIATAARYDVAADLPNMPVGGADFALRRRLDGGWTIARRNAHIAPITPDSFTFFADFLPSLVGNWRELSLRLNRHSLDESRIRRRWSPEGPSPFELCRILDPDPHSGHVRAAAERLARAFPASGGGHITHAWAGVIDATPDGIPAIGEIPGKPGLYLASGFSGHGFGIGPGAGRLIAQIIAGDTPCVDRAPFRPGRLVGVADRAGQLGRRVRETT